MAATYYKSRMPSKADLSVNWRTSRAGSKPPANVFRAFAKKPRLVNLYPAQPHLWSDFTICGADVKKCELCKINVLRGAAVFPQVLNTCGHIFCAKCIYDHYVVANKKQCPTCAAYICPYDNFDDDERYIRGLEVGYEEYCGEEEEPRCPCAWPTCSGDCGTLSCGCIDTCRGRCEDRYDD